MYLILFSSFPIRQLTVGYIFDIGIFYFGRQKQKRTNISETYLNLPFERKMTISYVSLLANVKSRQETG